MTDTTENTTQGHWFYRLVAESDSTDRVSVVIDPLTAVQTADDATTNEVAGALWLAETPPPDVSDDNTDTDRRFRISVVLTWIVLLSFIATGGVYAFFQPSRAADATHDEYTSALVALHGEMVAAQNALDVITGSATSAADLGTVYAPLASFDGRASIVRAVAVAPLPQPWPLVPSAPIDDLDSLRSEIGVIATSSSALADRLKTALDYRASLSSVGKLPDLPVVADAAAVNTLSVSLASYLADSTTVANGLPTHAAFADHRDSLRSWLDALSGLQVTYLDALRNADAAIAANAVNDIYEGELSVTVSLTEALATLRVTLDKLILETADAIALVVNA